MSDPQFYPTPGDLAARMIAKFNASPFERDARVLEPSAGEGALALALAAASETNRQAKMLKYRGYWSRETVNIDFIEIDMRKHATLENLDGVKGRVIGLDFLQFSGSLAAYTHVLMNPPFKDGVHHILKAWEGLFDGEIVCLLNAETVRNPFSKERQRLVRLIEELGDVEFLQDAFKGENVEREANVEVAIVHLVKKADLHHDVIGDALSGLQEDALHETGGSGAYASMVNNQELAIPGDVIVMTERAFKAAVKAMQEAALANARADHLSRLVGQTMAQRNGEAKGDKTENMAKSIREAIAKGYDELKDRAWSEVLRSTKVSSKLSSKAQRRLESDFERIKRLDFSASNVYAFLIGLIESQGDMHLQMACDCFDEITKYHEDNTVWYMGWKSNGKHRTAGRRIKMTRFILPYFESRWSDHSLGYGETQRLRDFDKVFEVLDGKAVGSSFGLADLFQRDSKSLAAGDRLASDYFEVRWYPKRGTIHFFPKRKDLIDRLNRVVGRARQWLPESEDLASKDFWMAYDQAEKFSAEVAATVGDSKGWNNPFSKASRGDDEESIHAQDVIAQACIKAAQDHGLDLLGRIAKTSNDCQPLLLEAA